MQRDDHDDVSEGIRRYHAERAQAVANHHFETPDVSPKPSQRDLVRASLLACPGPIEGSKILQRRFLERSIRG